MTSLLAASLAFSALAFAQAPPKPVPAKAGPVPRAVDGKPDLSGIFSGGGSPPGYKPERISFQPSMEEQRQKFIAQP